MTKIRNSPLDLHRQVWLDAHPDRDVEWLLRMAKEGFDIHHVDGDHENNDPTNLVLIEHLDHFMLHSGKRPTRILYPRVVTKDAPSTIPYWWDEHPVRQIAGGLTTDERHADAIVEYLSAQRTLVESLDP